MGMFDSLFGGGDGPDYDEILAESRIQSSPISATTGAGTATFKPGIDGSPASISTELNPELKAGQGAFFGIGTDTLDYLKDFDPEAYAKEYFGNLRSLREPGEEQALGRLQDRMFTTGRKGFGSGVGSPTGMHQSPEMAAYYGALQQQLSADALAADNQAFSRFNNLLSRAGSSYGQGIALDSAVMNPLAMAGNMQGQVYGNERINKENIMNARFAEASDEGGGLFEDLLGVGLNVGLGYLTGGASGALMGGMSSMGSMGAPGNAFSSGFGWGGGGSTLFGGLGTIPFSQQSRMLASQVF